MPAVVNSIKLWGVNSCRIGHRLFLGVSFHRLLYTSVVPLELVSTITFSFVQLFKTPVGYLVNSSVSIMTSLGYINGAALKNSSVAAHISVICWLLPILLLDTGFATFLGASNRVGSILRPLFKILSLAQHSIVRTSDGTSFGIYLAFERISVLTFIENFILTLTRIEAFLHSNPQLLRKSWVEVVTLLLAEPQFKQCSFLSAMLTSPLQASVSFISFVTNLIFVLRIYERCVSDYDARWDLLITASAICDNRVLEVFVFRNTSTSVRGFSHFNLVGEAGSSEILSGNNLNSLDAIHMLLYSNLFSLFSGVQVVTNVGFDSIVPNTGFGFGCVILRVENPNVFEILHSLWNIDTVAAAPLPGDGGAAPTN